MEESDVEAVARAKAGDRDGFRILVERHGRSVFRLAYRMTGNEQDAEDVVQDTFLLEGLPAARQLRGAFELRDLALPDCLELLPRPCQVPATA